MSQSSAGNRILKTAMAALFAAAIVPGARAQEIEFEEAALFLELNDTDGDLGIHAMIDGEPWKVLEIENDNDQVLLEIRTANRLRQQGLTEIAFESAEPPFDELPPEEFLARFPAGTYEISGITLEGDELESEVELSHVLAAPAVVRVNGLPVSEDCENDPGPTVSDPVIVDWDEVTDSHPEIGDPGPIEVELYQFFLESDEVTIGAETLPPDVTEFEIPSNILALSDEWKIEVLVRTDTHNNTAVESCFVVE